ncbi:MAG: hypothetical protein FOGNACKC_03950 [Anaerolineae bacterium]|nr:hypothetical protein [Anaerolineae bacterium]
MTTLLTNPKLKTLSIYALLVALIAPSIVWVMFDKSVWAWDQAGYGQAAVDLFYTLRHAPREWPEAMMQAVGRKPPAIAWAGQFFVPLGSLTGSIEAGLLVLVLIVQALNLVVMYRAIRELSGGNTLIAVTGSLAMASAPLFVGMSHQFFVEPLQLLAVNWFLLIMSFAPKWDRAFILSQLLAAAAFATLVKTTSPIYCVGPGLVALKFIIWPGSNREVAFRWTQKLTLVSLSGGAILTALALGWYSRNLTQVLRHISVSSSGPVAELYGKSEPYFYSFGYWLEASQRNFFVPAVLVMFALLVGAGFVYFVKHRPAGVTFITGCAGIAVLQIIIVLALFSASPNRDNRYLLPLLPYFSLLLGWALVQINVKPIIGAAIAVFLVQWMLIYGQAFALTAPNPQLSDWLLPITRNSRQANILNAIVARTCTETGAERYTVIGVELSWLNSETVSFFASKNRLQTHRRCFYIPLGFAESDPEVVVAAVMTFDPIYFVTLDPDLYPIPTNPLNQVDLAILEQARDEKTIAEDEPLAEEPAVLFFHRIED